MPNAPKQDFVAELCDAGSDACHKSLAELAVVLQHIGYRVWNKSPREATLRVYYKEKRYPLFNPRFRQIPIDEVESKQQPALVVTVISKGDDALDNWLKSFESGPDIWFSLTSILSNRYYYHGDFVIPLEAAIRDDQLDLSVVIPSLRMIFQISRGESTMSAG